MALLAVLAALGISFNWLHLTPDDCYTKGMAIGSSVCHQLSSHSIIREGVQFPLCARCSGLYLGCLIALAYYTTRGKKNGLPKRGYLLTLLFMTLAWAGDGVNSFISDFVGQPFLWTTSNTTRLVTGFGMGLVLSTALMTLFNLTVWKERQKEPLLNHIWQIGAYALAAAGLGALLLFGNLLVFYALANISIFTILVVISLLYTIFWVIVLKKDNTFTNLKALVFYLAAGFASAMLQITLMTSLRSWLLS